MKKFEEIIKGLDIEARDYQKRVVEKVLGHIESGVDSVLIQAPTGSGKTVMSMTALKALTEVYGNRIGWSAMRRNLLTQASRENKNKGFNLDMQMISIFQKNIPEVDILVVDEAQHDATTSVQDVRAKSKAKIVIGLSATPMRHDKANLLFKKTVREANIRMMVRDGYLSKFNHFTLTDWTPKTVARAFLMDPEEWGKSVFFFPDLGQCAEFQGYLKQAGFESEFVHGQSDKEAQIERFLDKEDSLNILINAHILTEGFDCPDLKTAWVKPSYKGAVVQMAGRALRLDESVPVANVVQSGSKGFQFSQEAKAERTCAIVDGEIINLNSSAEKIKEVAIATARRKANANIQKILNQKEKMAA